MGWTGFKGCGLAGCMAVAGCGGFMDSPDRVDRWDAPAAQGEDFRPALGPVSDWPNDGALKEVELSGNVGEMSAQRWEIMDEYTYGYVSPSDVMVEVYVQEGPRQYGMVNAWAFVEEGIREGDVVEIGDWESSSGGVSCVGPSPGEWEQDMGATAGTLERVGQNDDGDTVVAFELWFGSFGHVEGTAVLETVDLDAGW